LVTVTRSRDTATSASRLPVSCSTDGRRELESKVSKDTIEDLAQRCDELNFAINASRILTQAKEKLASGFSGQPLRSCDSLKILGDKINTPFTQKTFARVLDGCQVPMGLKLCQRLEAAMKMSAKVLSCPPAFGAFMRRYKTLEPAGRRPAPDAPAHAFVPARTGQGEP